MMEPLPGKVQEFVAGARVCRIATVRATGAPHVIPVCPVFDGESTVYVDIGRRSATSEGVRATGKVAVLIDQYDDDWSRLKGVLLHCRAEQVGSEELERAWDLIREKYPQYKPINWRPRFTLALRVCDWRQWGITEMPRYESE